MRTFIYLHRISIFAVFLFLIIILLSIKILHDNETHVVIYNALDRFSGIPEKTITLYSNNGSKILSITDKMNNENDSLPFYVIRNIHKIKFYGGVVVEEEFSDKDKPKITFGGN